MRIRAADVVSRQLGIGLRAAAVCAIAAVAVGALIFIAKNNSSMPGQAEGVTNPDYGGRRVTERMPSFSERPLRLPPSNVVGSYTPPAGGKPDPESEPKSQTPANR